VLKGIDVPPYGLGRANRGLADPGAIIARYLGTGLVGVKGRVARRAGEAATHLAQCRALSPGRLIELLQWALVAIFPMIGALACKALNAIDNTPNKVAFP
jgi:hypothetical protein